MGCAANWTKDLTNIRTVTSFSASMSMLFSNVAHPRTADEVAEQVEELILEGVLSSGDRLPGERELARQFDVSRPSLRDALKLLETRGLLVSRQGGGTFVADVVGEVFSAPLSTLIAASPRAASDYLEYRREMEGWAAEYAARRATADDLALLERIMERMRSAYREGDFETEARIDLEFHQAVGECAHNVILLHTLRACYRLLSKGILQTRLSVYDVAGAREALLQQHEAIHAAIKASDPDGARKAATAHILFVSEAIAEAARSGERKRNARLRLHQRLGDHS